MKYDWHWNWAHSSHIVAYLLGWPSRYRREAQPVRGSSLSTANVIDLWAACVWRLRFGFAVCAVLSAVQWACFMHKCVSIYLRGRKLKQMVCIDGSTEVCRVGTWIRYGWSRPRMNRKVNGFVFVWLAFRFECEFFTLESPRNEWHLVSAIVECFFAASAALTTGIRTAKGSCCGNISALKSHCPRPYPLLPPSPAVHTIANCIRTFSLFANTSRTWTFCHFLPINFELNASRDVMSSHTHTHGVAAEAVCARDEIPAPAVSRCSPGVRLGAGVRV